jgi:hypothetical protein
MEDDNFDPRPWGEQQEQTDPDEYDGDYDWNS